ncbi:MAG TPA: sodium:proton antiporter [Thermotogae bacterium]|nr:energy-converting hydrogenase subunit [Thermotogota bacterium]HCZ07212.1 sodium:proton antiporter [Thermotogota bacterium]
MTLLEYVIVGVMFLLGIMAVEVRNLFYSVIFLSALSILAAFVFVLMRAPDVAMAEAAIGSGLLTAILLFTLKRVEGGKNE